MVAMKSNRLYKHVPGVILLLAGLLAMTMVSAIDNPDAPDQVAQFEARIQKLAQAVDRPELTNRGILVAYDDYQILLDRELNKVYHLLRSKLPKAQQSELKKSQMNWLKFRDAEYELIQNNWTSNNFGRSAGRSRGDYRSTIVKDRIIQLLHYLQNY